VTRLRPVVAVPLALAGCVAVAAVGAGCDGSLPSGPRTVKLSSGPSSLVGTDQGGCSHGQAAGLTPADRWCAFARPVPDGAPAELWVVNVTRAAAGAPPPNQVGVSAAPFRCDGSSPHCRQLTNALWTGQPVFARSHPFIHGFEGDTLVFYADARSKQPDEPYAGPIRAWRPELAAPLELTGPAGFECLGHRDSDGVLCLENLHQTVDDLTFELLAGRLSLAGAGPLPFVVSVRPEDRRGISLWDVRFSPGGKHLLLSTWAPDAPVQQLQIVEGARVGQAPLRELLRDVVSFRLSPDGGRLFYLEGYDVTKGGDAMGTLTAVDFPSLANRVSLQPRVSRFELHGEPGGPVRGVSFFQDVKEGLGAFRMIPDVHHPDELVTIAANVEEASVSPDGRYTLYYDFDAQGDQLSMLAQNDGSGRCLLNAKPGHNAFGLVYPGVGQQVFWGEDSEMDVGRIEGYFADPGTCQGKTRFSPRVAYLQATRRGIVFAEEGGAPPLSMTLRHGHLEDDKLVSKEIARNADTTVMLVDRSYLVFSVNRGSEDDIGLYVHGPLP
jgi:hypothetical protein